MSVIQNNHFGKQAKRTVGSELLFDVFSQRYELGATLMTSNLPFDEWTSVFGSERLTGVHFDRFIHPGHIQEMSGESFRRRTSKKAQRRQTHALENRVACALKSDPP
jgi:DNA replication protein DnaC